MEYSVRCQVIEQDTPLIDLTLSVPTQAEAETIANNWAKKKSGSLCLNHVSSTLKVKQRGITMKLKKWLNSISVSLKLAALRSEEGSPCFHIAPEGGRGRPKMVHRRGTAGYVRDRTVHARHYRRQYRHLCGLQAGRIPGRRIRNPGRYLPSIVIICLVASILQNFIHLPVVLHALAGIRIVVCALMLNTVVTMAKKGIVDRLGALLFVAAFLLACFTPFHRCHRHPGGYRGSRHQKIGGRKES